MDIKINTINKLYNDLNIRFEDFNNKINDINNIKNLKKNKIYRSIKFKTCITNIILELENFITFFENNLLDIDNVCIEKNQIEPNLNMNKILKEHYLNKKVFNAFKIPMLLYKINLEKQMDNNNEL